MSSPVKQKFKLKNYLNGKLFFYISISIIIIELINSIMSNSFEILKISLYLVASFVLIIFYIKNDADLDLFFKTVCASLIGLELTSLICNYTPLCNPEVSPVEKALFSCALVIIMIFLKYRLDKSPMLAGKVFSQFITVSALLLLFLAAREQLMDLYVNSTLIFFLIAVINFFVLFYINRKHGFTPQFKKNILIYSVVLLTAVSLLEIVSLFSLINNAYLEKISLARSPIYLIAFLTCSVAIFLSKSDDAISTSLIHTKRNSTKKRILIAFILFLILITFFLFGSFHLGKFMSVDEPKWVFSRIPQLYDSLGSGDWENTYINDKPGVLPSILAGISNPFFKNVELNSTNFSKYLFFSRLPLIIFNTVLLAISFFISKRIVGIKTSLFFVAFLALNPILIGISQVINPDATLWSTSLVSFLSFFAYMKTSKKSYIYLSGLFLGLALISKYFASVFYITFLVAIVLEYLISRPTIEKTFTRLWDLGKIVLISVAVYVFMFPATWGNLDLILNGTLGSSMITPARLFLSLLLLILFLNALNNTSGKKNNNNFLELCVKNKNFWNLVVFLTLLIVLFFTINTLSNYPIFDFKNTLANFSARDGTILESILTSGTITLLFLPLPILAGLIICILNFRNGIMKGYGFFMNTLIITVATTVVLFIIGASLKGFVATARYQVMLIPLYVFCSILGFKSLKKYSTAILITGVGFMFYVTINTAPFYIHYSNEININNEIITEAWGYGGYEIAQRLNDLPNSEKLNVWVDREGFSQFFSGNTQWRSSINPLLKASQTNYIILTPGGKKILKNSLKNANLDYQTAKYIDKMMSYYESEADFQFCLNESANCIKVFRLEESEKESN